MKKILALVLAMMMLPAAFPALGEGADTVPQETVVYDQAVPPEADVQVMQVETDGVLEAVTQTRFTENILGISFWYESEYLVVYDSVGEVEDLPTIIINPVGEDSMLPVYLEITAADALGMTPEQFLEEMPGIYGLDEAGPVTEVVMDTGEDFSCRSGLRGDIYYEFYTVTGSDVPLCITVQFPLDAIEGYGARLDRLIWSIAFIR